MRNTLLAVLIGVGLVIGAVIPATATPSFLGYTGLVNIPTADSLSMGEYNAAAFFAGGDGGNDTVIAAGNLGIIAGLEGGVAYVNPDEGSDELLLNAKWRIRSEGTVMPAIAVGMADIGDQIDSTPYLVLSKGLAPVGRKILNPQVHVGVGDGLLDGFFAGASVDIAKTTTLMAEYDGRDVNFGARFAISPELRIHAAGFDGFDDFGVGISYTKGL